MALISMAVWDTEENKRTAYQGWKHKVAGEDMDTFNLIKQDYRSGKRPIFEEA